MFIFHAHSQVAVKIGERTNINWMVYSPSTSNIPFELSKLNKTTRRFETIFTNIPGKSQASISSAFGKRAKIMIIKTLLFVTVMLELRIVDFEDHTYYKFSLEEPLKTKKVLYSLVKVSGEFLFYVKKKYESQKKCVKFILCYEIY